MPDAFQKAAASPARLLSRSLCVVALGMVAPPRAAAVDPVAKKFLENEMAVRRSQVEQLGGAQQGEVAAQKEATEQSEIPGIAGAPPGPSAISRLLPSKSPFSFHHVPGWCKDTEGVPRAATLRAHGFAKLARRHVEDAEIIMQPSDPLEWGCSHPWAAWFFYALIIWFVGTMASFLVASFWCRGWVPKYDEASSLSPEGTFQNGHFACLSDMNTCIMAFFCPVVRWAETVHMAGLLTFWFAFWILAVCYLPVVFFGFMGLFLVVPLVHFRQRLRDKIGVPSGNETYVTDCCFACWCSCCLIAQEARVVNEAYIVGHTAMPVSGGQTS